MLTEELLLSTIFVAGILSFFSPCIFPVIPVYLSILTVNEKKSIGRTIMFVSGLSLTFLVLGFGAGFIGELFFNNKIRIIGGVIIVILGLFQMELIKLNFLERTKILNFDMTKNENFFTPFILGFSFSLGWTPCVGPVLASIIFISGSSENISKSLLMMTIYILGLALPFIIFSLASNILFKKLSFLKKYLNIFKKIGGFIIFMMGILLIFDKINFILNL